MWRRRAIVSVSLLGMASMGAVSLLQTGVLKHLLDPPLAGFNSDKVNLSDVAYQFGVPDGTLGVVGFAAKLTMATFGGIDRGTDQPLVPPAAAGKAALAAPRKG